MVTLLAVLTVAVGGGAAARTSRASEIAKLLGEARSGFAAGADISIPVLRLATLRAVEATPFLADHLDYIPPREGRPHSGFHDLSHILPCAFALGQIGGRECHDALLTRLAKESAAVPESIQYTAIVMKMSLGCDDAIAVLRGRAAKHADPIVAARLREVADWIDRRERKTTYN